jgi:hypothetical protein
VAPQDPSGFYDPYRGPVPNTFNDQHRPEGQVQGYGAEAIPMTQMVRTRSPGPGMAYDVGRQSPQPAMMVSTFILILDLSRLITVVGGTGSTITRTASWARSNIPRTPYGLWGSNDGDTWKTTLPL